MAFVSLCELLKDDVLKHRNMKVVRCLFFVVSY